MNEHEMQDELERRLRGVNEALPEERGFSERVMMRIQAEAIPPAREKDHRLWRFVMKGVIGIAAGLAVGVAVWHFSMGAPRAAFAVEDIPQRMLGLKSLHLKGEVYSSDGTARQRIEIFLQRPGLVRLNGVPVRTTKDAGKEVLESFDLILTPKGRIQIDARKKQVGMLVESEIDAQLLAEQIFQQNVQMLLGSGEDFKKVRSEKTGGIEADVYESRIELPAAKSRVEVYMNPATGLPVRSEIYSTRGGNPEKPEMLFDAIEPDAVIPPGTFKFDVPADYQVTQTPAQFSFMNTQLNEAQFGMRFAIALNNKSFLVCWRAYDMHRPAEDLNFFREKGNQLIIRGNGGVEYQERLLRADETPEGYHWRWSLVTTEKPASAWASAVSMGMRMNGGVATDGFMPVKLPEGELADVVVRAQRETLPAGKEPMTLMQIEAEMAK